jgi:competence protein ComEC
MDLSMKRQNELWKIAPYLRLLLPFLAGILMESKFPVLVWSLIPIFLFSIVLIVTCSSISFLLYVGLECVSGVIIQIAVFSFAAISVQLHKDTQIEHSSCYLQKQSNLLLLRLLDDPVQKQNSWKCLAHIKWLVKDHICFNENERIIIHFYKKPDARQYSDGSLIIFRKELRPIKNLGPSGDFDYEKYCHLRHIYAQVFLKEDEYALVLPGKEISFSTVLSSLRRKLLIIIKNYVPGTNEHSLLEALMVGFTDDLEPRVLKSYADTGIIHIIAISGLHLALICHILQIISQKTGRKKWIQWLRLGLIITTLWMYSILSGGSPSVIRSAGMFTITLFARNILREPVLYNTLACSAFLLLCFDHNWIWDPGFQLSYSAVLSLGLFAKPIRNIIRVKNKLLVLIWNAASVSLAAQILTIPISIFYFHRFPSYFLIANLVAVPLSSIVLIGGILLCICSFVHPLGRFLGWILNYMIHFLNGFVQYISRLPGAVVSHLNISLILVFLIYFVIFCFYRFLFLRRVSWLIAGLASISFWQLLHLIH